jgi:hypothetical protein
MRLPFLRAASRRAALVATLGCAIAACDSSTAPAPPVPAQGAAAPAAPAPLHLEFSADTGVIGTQAGVRMPGLGVASHGQPGWLAFGPYAALPAGRYRARVLGRVLPDHAGHVHADVALEQGKVLLAALELDAAQVQAGVSGPVLFTMDFQVPQAVEGVEVRVQVDAQARIGVTGVQIDAMP